MSERVLVLGGTRFVGRAIVEAALSAGHEVTLFNRGSAPDLFPGARRILGDRDTADIDRIAQATWDCVVDVSGYRPAQVRGVLHALGDRVSHYLFISTVSVYATPLPPGAAEDAPLIVVDETVPPGDPLAYGGLKVLCEQELRARLDGLLTVVRPTVVIGPHDTTDRFPWWVRLVARGGRIEVPARVDQPLQLIDAADLSAFVVRAIEQRVGGTFNVVGPAAPLTLRGLIDLLSVALDSNVEPVPAAGGAGARIPLTTDPEGTADGLFAVSGEAAYRAGLTLRPLEQSAREVLSTEQARSESR